MIALRLIDEFDSSVAPERVKVGVISARCHAYLTRGDGAQGIFGGAENLHVAAVLIRTYYLAGDNEAASKALDEAVATVSETTKLSSCLLLEAQRLDRNDAIVQLLKGRVATDHESEALRLLVAAEINGRFWVTAQETLDAIQPPLQTQEWVQRAQTILALNTGHSDAEQKIGAYLKQWPKWAIAHRQPSQPCQGRNSQAPGPIRRSMLGRRAYSLEVEFWAGANAPLLHPRLVGEQRAFADGMDT